MIWMPGGWHVNTEATTEKKAMLPGFRVAVARDRERETLRSQEVE
jgi:hypothetical protein